MTPRLPGPESLAPISPLELPANAAQEFWHRSGLGTNRPGLVPSGFDRLLVADHGAERSYVAHHAKTADLYDGEVACELATYVAEVDDDGRLIGVGEVRFLTGSDRPFHVAKPFAAWTRTEDAHRQAGVGRRRLLTMNAASLLIHGLPLHSGTLFGHEAVERMWDSLVAEKVAECYTEHDTWYEGGLKRYRFLANNGTDLVQIKKPQ